MINRPNMSIDTSSVQSLITQAKEQSSIYSNYGEMLVLAEEEIENQKLNVDIAKMNAGKKLRVLNSNISETKLDKLLHDDQEYVESIRRLNKAKTQAGLIKTYIKSLDKKFTTILTACGLMKEELKQLGVSEHI